MYDKIYQRQFKSTLSRIGACMLVFFALIQILPLIGEIVGGMMQLVMTPKSFYVANSLMDSAIYMLCFSIPAAFFYAISPKQDVRPVMTEVKLNKYFPLMLLASVAISLAMVYVNSYIMEIFNFSSFINAYIANEPIDEVYKLILAVISTALVPALCEEYLFRGVVLTNLLPYGRTVAIVCSAVLFGLMHQNPGQLVYTTVAGVLIGLIYVRTGSLWSGVIFHFLYNLVAVVEQFISDQLVTEQATTICLAIEAALMIVGAVSVIILLYAERKRKRDFSESGFGVVLSADENYVERPMSRGGAAQMLKTPTIVIFGVLCACEMLLYILISAGVIVL